MDIKDVKMKFLELIVQRRTFQGDLVAFRGFQNSDNTLIRFDPYPVFKLNADNINLSTIAEVILPARKDPSRNQMGKLAPPPNIHFNLRTIDCL